MTRAMARTVVVVVVALTALSLIPGIARAAQLTGPPDANGHWINCDARILGTTNAGLRGVFKIGVACQYGPSSAVVNQFKWRYGNNATFTTWSIADSCAQATCAKGGAPGSGAGSVLLNGNGQFQITWQETSSITTADVGYIAVAQVWIAGSTTGTGAMIFQTNAGGAVCASGANDTTCPEVGLTYGFGATNIPTMPSDYFPGGSTGANAPAPTATPCAVPDNTCPSADATPPADNATGTPAGSTESCGAWWHIACHFRNVMRWVFVPSRSLSNDVSTLADSAATHYPFGPIIQGVGLLHDMWSTFVTNASDPQSGANANCTVSTPFGRDQWGDPLTPPGTNETPVTMLDACASTGWVAAIGPTTLILSRFIMAFAFVWGMIRLGTWMMGGGSSGGDDS